MASLNKVQIIGNCCSDIEVRYAPSGVSVASVSVATNERWKDKETGEKKERAEFHRVVFYNRLAEIAGEYLRKGSQVYVEGSLRTRKWQDKNTGQDRYTTEIIASEMQMLGGKGSGSDSSNAPAQAPGQSVPAPAGKNFDDFDDDIPW